MLFIIFYLLCVFLVSVYATRVTRRRWWIWFLLALLITPLVTFLILLIAGKNRMKFKKCTKCFEVIKTEAILCRFCKSEQN